LNIRLQWRLQLHSSSNDWVAVEKKLRPAVKVVGRSVTVMKAPKLRWRTSSQLGSLNTFDRTGNALELSDLLSRCKISKPRLSPRHPKIANAGFRLALPIADYFFRAKHIHRSDSQFAAGRMRNLAATLARGDTAYLAGVSVGGFHNTGVALVEVKSGSGPQLIFNNEEERFTGQKHTNKYPHASLEESLKTMNRMGIDPAKISAWLATYDYPAFIASGFRTILEEFPASLKLMFQDHNPAYDGEHFKDGIAAPSRLATLLGLNDPVPLIAMAHHDSHAWFSYLVSPFARDVKPVMVVVVDGSGDTSSISLYIGVNSLLKKVRSNNSLFDSIGLFYAVMSSTQGGWTSLSSEGRYMGAAAYGDSDRSTNTFYRSMQRILALQEDGHVVLNRSLARWPSQMFRKPYSKELSQIFGPPILPEEMWNPDAVLRVEDIHHKPNTQDRLDKAAATQMVFEDALFHIIDFFIRTTGSDRLVLTGGAALNAVANMRLLDHFDESYFRRTLQKSTRLHLWAPPVSGDSGVTVGAAFAFAAASGVVAGPSMQHAFYCGNAPTTLEIEDALGGASDISWSCFGGVQEALGRDAVADLMAFITSRDGIIAIFQGAAETGPRALGHRSIVANPCNPLTRDYLNARVKYREPIRPLAPMATLCAAQQFFELSAGAADDDYNAYNYMVITAKAKLEARSRIPAVVHADGTARLQIVRETDPITFAYLKALGRRIGVEMAVNTSFNVAGPIAQSPIQALETLRRANGMDGVFMVSERGDAYVAWVKGSNVRAAGRIENWIAEWRAEVGSPLSSMLLGEGT
jgi:carbamoyltransferase